MPAPISIFARIVDKVSLMNKEQQKILWLQLNKESIYDSASRIDEKANGELSMDDIVKISNYGSRQKKKN